MKEHDISVKGASCPPPILSFEDGTIPKNILNHVLLQFDKPTPIQAQVTFKVLTFLVLHGIFTQFIEHHSIYSLLNYTIINFNMIYVLIITM